MRMASGVRLRSCGRQQQGGRRGIPGGGVQMNRTESEKARGGLRGRRGIVLAALLLLLLALAAQLMLARRFNTAQVQQRLSATVARESDSLYLVRIGSSHLSLLGRS